MMKLVVLRLKELRAYAFLLIALTAGLLGLSYLSSASLAENAPPPSIALYDADGGVEAAELIATLETVSDLRLRIVTKREEGQSLLTKRSVSAFAVIEPGFAGRVLKKGAVDFFPASGATEASALSEHVTAAILRMRAQYKLDSALAETGVDAPRLKDAVEPVIGVIYSGPPVLSQTLPPRHGVALLLFLLSGVHAAVVLAANNRIRALGRCAALKSYVSGVICVFLVWWMILAVYLGFIRVTYGVAAGFHEVFAVTALIAYSIGLGGLFAAVGKAGAFFLPYLLINMTAGGGLWESILTPWYLMPFVPLAPALLGCAGEAVYTVLLLVLGIIMIFGGGVLYVLQKLRTKPS